MHQPKNGIKARKTANSMQEIGKCCDRKSEDKWKNVKTKILAPEANAITTLPRVRHQGHIKEVEIL
jgi:predicted NAD-dependent protein-ADP-ribosyltransferase YbiA (DUF1768 family)